MSSAEPRPASRLWVGAAIGAVLLLMLFGRRIIPAGGADDPNAPRKQIVEIQDALDRYRQDRGGYPTSAQGLDALRGPYLPAGVPSDPWGRPYRYTAPAPGGYILSTLGSDGRPGGTGTAADVVVTGS